VVQLNHLRTHPSVAAGLAKGQLRLHGWFFELETGNLLAYCGAKGCFVPFAEADEEMPVAQASAVRVAAPEIAGSFPHAAE
jgi:carbonic anhydrase